MLKKKKIVIVEMDDLNFHFGSSVLLPVPHDLNSHDQQYVGGLRVMSRAMTYIIESGHKLLIAGHTDSVGGGGANCELSQARCDNVLFFLQGHYDAWAEACAQHKVEDYQNILNWIADTRGWDCDPGDIDNLDGPKTQSALKGFRKAYRLAFEQELQDRSTPSAEDWRAFANLYETAIEEHVDVQRARSSITFITPSTLACGEHWPEQGKYQDNIRSAENRRVEFLFFADTADLPDFAASSPPGYEIYGTELFFVREYLDVHEEYRFYFSV